MWSYFKYKFLHYRRNTNYDEYYQSLGVYYQAARNGNFIAALQSKTAPHTKKLRNISCQHFAWEHGNKLPAFAHLYAHITCDLHVRFLARFVWLRTLGVKQKFCTTASRYSYSRPVAVGTDAVGKWKVIYCHYDLQGTKNPLPVCFSGRFAELLFCYWARIWCKCNT